MSIINQMLQDLEARSVKPGEADPSTPGEVQAPKFTLSWRSSLNKNKIEKWVLVILLVVFAIFVSRLVYFHKKPAAVPPLTASQAISPATKPTAELNNITLKKDAALTTITFSSSQPITYRLEQDTTAGTLKLFFENVKLTSTLPNDFTESVVENIQTAGVNSDTVVTITLKKNATLLGLVPQANDAKSLVLNLKNAEPSEEVGEMTKTLEPLDNQQLAEKAYNQALIALNDGNINEAIRDLQHSLTQQADYLPAQQTLITLLLQQKENDLAGKYLDQALSQRPQNLQLLQLKARAELMANNPSAALHTLQSYSPPLANNLEYYALIAAIQQQLGNYALAEQLYRQILMIQSNQGKWWVGLGIALEAEQNINEAMAAYQRAAVLHTLDPNLQAFVDAKLTAT